MAKPEASDYKLSKDPVYSDSQLNRYATDDPTLFIEKFVAPKPTPGAMAPDFSRYLEIYDGVQIRLLEKKLSAFTPEIVDSDVEDSWVAFGVEPGLYSITEALKSFPDGISGRDWAWIFRRILMVLHTANRRPMLTAENILIHPENHGVVLLGWHPVEDPNIFPLDQLKDLMESILSRSVDTERLISFVEKSAAAYSANRAGQQAVKIDPDRALYSYDDALREFDMLLNNLYGPRKFHPFIVDGAKSTGYLEVESRLVKDGKG